MLTNVYLMPMRYFVDLKMFGMYTLIIIKYCCPLWNEDNPKFLGC